MKSLAPGLAVLTFVGIAAAHAQSLVLAPEQRVPHPLVDPASDDARLALQRFRLPPGLKAELWAAEPMLANPVAIDFDEKGRLFVAETHRYGSSTLDIRGYMGMLERDLAARTIEDRARMILEVFGEEQAQQLAIESEIVRLVEDRDGDGVADTSSVFAAGFDTMLDGIASGVLARKGRVWLTNIPSLWLLEEAPGEQGAVKRTELLRGFGVRFNFTGHDLHGLALGHDGKLYYSIGDRGAHVVGKDGQIIAVPDEGAVFRSNPDGTELELFARGLRNPQELVFDEHGNLFTGDNDADAGDLERLVYLVEGGDSGWRVGYQHPPLGKNNPWLREGLWKPRFEGQPAYFLPPIANIEDGPSGMTYYPGSGLSPEYRGHFFIAHFKGTIARSGIQSYTLKQQGAGFAVTSSSQFMGGLLATDVTFGPDGAMYVSDWVEGWPKSRRGRIYKISAVDPDPTQKALSEELALLLAQGLERADTTTLRRLLAHPDRRARLEAQFTLVERGKSSIPVLTDVATSVVAAPLARLHAIWGLTQLGREHKQPAATLLTLLDDPDPEVRAQAAKGLGDLRTSVAYAALVRKLDDAAPRVQFFAAQSLGKLGRSEATGALLALLRRNDNRDVYLRHAAVHALMRIGKTPVLEAAAKDPSAAVRLGVLLAYRGLGDAAIAQFLDDGDDYIVREAAIAINDVPIEGAYDALATKLAAATSADEAFVLRAINANFRLGQPRHARALAQFAARHDASPDMRAEAITQLGLWSEVPQRDRIVGVYRPLPARDPATAREALAAVLPRLLDKTPPAVQLAAIEAVSKLQLRDASTLLVAVVANEQAHGSVRARALEVLDAFDDAAVERGIDAAQRSNEPMLRLAALQILARKAPQRALPIVRQLVMNGTAAEQKAAFSALAELNEPEAPRLLALGLERLAAGKIHLDAQVELLDAAERSDDPLVRTRWNAIQAQWSASGDPLAPYRSALGTGNVVRGAHIFQRHPVLACIRCHRVNGDGGEAGPDLTLIGAQRSPEYLLESIVAPNARIAEGFHLVTLKLQDGSYESGTLVSETEHEIVVRRADGSDARIDVSRIAERQAAPSSMPDIYKDVLSRSELRDLLAYLRVLTVDRTQLEDRARATSGE
ncbi:MAG: HEAT repeat domain-containing protein [Gammaproteobacteria bacterium]|nr:heme-binding protein [Gammaproteobacteria bacterium]